MPFVLLLLPDWVLALVWHGVVREREREREYVSVAIQDAKNDGVMRG